MLSKGSCISYWPTREEKKIKLGLRLELMMWLAIVASGWGQFNMSHEQVTSEWVNASYHLQLQLLKSTAPNNLASQACKLRNPLILLGHMQGTQIHLKMRCFHIYKWNIGKWTVELMIRCMEGQILLATWATSQLQFQDGLVKHNTLSNYSHCPIYFYDLIIYFWFIIFWS